ncbi:hypothetical protein COV20_00295 [Candidatus Woesearchaeota archaeon CG10_big_fil_rev_8_21_14_0_10_45_16]|nr:MAG: hypothetical protein COV20_00295 [Candidatus Woesearchaeota archaeon CG10_big_fil_rev_8_21_14_0_10_45_16]
MFHQLSLIFGSMTKAQEILLLLNDKKAVVRHGFYEEELPAVERFCDKNNLIMVKSKFKVLLADETSYSNKGIRIMAEDKRPGMYFVYISKDEEKAWKASYFELMGSDRDLGKILGYPNCCVDFFCKRFTPDNPNLQLTPSNPWTNLSKRGQDAVLISHFPCSSDCEESIKLAKVCLDSVLKADYQRAEDLLRILKP